MAMRRSGKKSNGKKNKRGQGSSVDGPQKKKIRLSKDLEVNAFLNDDSDSDGTTNNIKSNDNQTKIAEPTVGTKNKNKNTNKNKSKNKSKKKNTINGSQSKPKPKLKSKSNSNGNSNSNSNSSLIEKMDEKENKNVEDKREEKKLSELPTNNDSFDSLDIREDTLAMINSLGFTRMLEIQRKSIPLLLKGNNLVGAAKTGSGKTLAYVIPAIERVLNLDWDFAELGVACIILAPTRELAIQIQLVMKKLLRLYKDSISLGLLIGGNPRSRDISNMTKYGMTIVIATPGRLLDHMMQTREFLTKNLKILILDEADRMLEEGYQEEINQILKRLPKKNRQTILFSATQTRKTQDLIRLSFESKPLFVGLDEPRSVINVNNKNKDGKILINPTREDLTQGYILVPTEKKFLLLFSFLKRNLVNKKILVFFSTVNVTKYFVELLNYIDIKVYGLYGAMSQKQRTKTFLEFQDSKSGILLATNVAARGLDIPNIDWIVQYDPSDDVKDYIHRVGRTCRGADDRNNSNSNSNSNEKKRKGKALLFLTPNEVGYLNVLQKHNINVKEFTLPQSSKIANIQSQLEKLTSNVYHLHVLAHHAYTAYMKQYALRNSKVFDVLKLDIVKVSKSFGLSAPPKVNVEIARKHKKKETNGRTTTQRRYKSVNLRLKTNQWAKKRQKSQFSFSFD